MKIDNINYSKDVKIALKDTLSFLKSGDLCEDRGYQGLGTNEEFLPFSPKAKKWNEIDDFVCAENPNSIKKLVKNLK